MQAPSTELLRALRLSLNSTARVSQRTCLRTQTISSSPAIQFRIPSTRTYATAVRDYDSPREERRSRNRYAPTHSDRGPKSTEDTQTDFGAMDVLGHVPTPATSIDACTSDGFHLDNGVKTEGGHGIVLVGGEAFNWDPWWLLPITEGSADQPLRISDMLDARKGTLNIPPQSLGLLELLHPKPDLLIFGTGAKLWMLSQECKKYLSDVIGCRIDVMDTANAAAAYNLLAKERGIEGGSGVGAVLLPGGWTGPKMQMGRRPGRR